MNGILITGSSGQLGLALKELSAGFKEIIFDFKSSTELDITNPSSINELFQKNNYSHCINCAAYTNVEQAEKTPEAASKVNTEGVRNLSLACKKHGTTLIHISTDYVFDGEKDSPYTIHDKPNPINEYGKSKLRGEEHIRNILDNHYILRTSWLYSKKYGHNFYRTILEKAKAGQELRITDQQLGSPTNTDTLARFILEEIIPGNKPFGTYHVTDGIPMTWHDFAKRILEENGLTEKAKLVLDRNYRTFAKRPKNSVLI
jgi:dTDP-4-dehydrorhamnose reductase